MPIVWTVNARARRVEAVASGSISAADLAALIAGLGEAGVVGHAKLIDLSHASLDIRAAEVRALAASINALARDGASLGPVAYVVDSDTALDTIMLLDDRTAESKRMLSIFGSRQHALDWLDGISVGR